MNKVILIGRNTNDIELKQTTQGTSVVEFSIVVDRPYKTNGKYESDFFTCIAFSKLAESIGRYVKKGDKIGIEGSLQTSNYTNREGKKVYVTKIMLERIEFLQQKKQEEPNSTEFEEIEPFNADLPFDTDLPFEI